MKPIKTTLGDPFFKFKKGQFTGPINDQYIKFGENSKFSWYKTKNQNFSVPGGIATIGTNNPDKALHGKILLLSETPKSLETFIHEALIERAKLINLALKGAFNLEVKMNGTGLDMNRIITESLKGGEIKISLE